MRSVMANSHTTDSIRHTPLHGLHAINQHAMHRRQPMPDSCVPSALPNARRLPLFSRPRSKSHPTSHNKPTATPSVISSPNMPSAERGEGAYPSLLARPEKVRGAGRAPSRCVVRPQRAPGPSMKPRRPRSHPTEAERVAGHMPQVQAPRGELLSMAPDCPRLKWTHDLLPSPVGCAKLTLRLLVHCHHRPLRLVGPAWHRGLRGRR